MIGTSVGHSTPGTTTTGLRDSRPPENEVTDAAHKACPFCALVERRDGQLRSPGACWLSRALAVLVVLCLALAAWVWLEILVVGW